jgi:hypothetical protein
VAGAALPDLDLFAADWHPLIRVLTAGDGLTIAAGGDVTGASGRVVGRFEAEVSRDGRRLRLLDARDPHCVEVEAASAREDIGCMRIHPESLEAPEQTAEAVWKALGV